MTVTAPRPLLALVAALMAAALITGAAAFIALVAVLPLRRSRAA